MLSDMTSAAAATHRRDLTTESAAAALAGLATALRPGARHPRAAQLLTLLRAGQLGPGYVDPRRDSLASADGRGQLALCP